MRFAYRTVGCRKKSCRIIPWVVGNNLGVYFFLGGYSVDYWEWRKRLLAFDDCGGAGSFFDAQVFR